MDLPGQPRPSAPQGYYSFPLPEHAELVVDAARHLPGKLLHWDLGHISVGEWSQLLFRALDGVKATPILVTFRLGRSFQRSGGSGWAIL